MHYKLLVSAEITFGRFYPFFNPRGKAVISNVSYVHLLVSAPFFDMLLFTPIEGLHFKIEETCKRYF